MLIILNAICLVALTILISFQPQNTEITTFKVPLTPFLQIVAIFVNVFLITTLSIDTFIRLGIWFAIGALVYLAYGLRKSKEHVKNKRQLRFLPCIERTNRQIENKDKEMIKKYKK